MVVDFCEAGGASAVMNELKDLLHLDCLTVNDTTLEGNLADKKSRNREVISKIRHPFHETGGLVVLKGNLAPAGAIARPTVVKKRDAQAHRPGKSFRLR